MRVRKPSRPGLRKKGCVGRCRGNEESYELPWAPTELTWFQGRSKDANFASAGDVLPRGNMQPYRDKRLMQVFHGSVALSRKGDRATQSTITVECKRSFRQRRPEVGKPA